MALGTKRYRIETMNWISDVLKHLTVSRSFVVAIFVTSGGLLFGNLYFPKLVKPLPDQWAIAASGALIFSSVLLLWWLIPAIWNYISRLVQSVIQVLNSYSLSKLEESILLALGNLADESLDLRTINYSEINLPKLEILNLTTSLAKKGLVRINPFEENLVSLTKRGRQRALKIQRRESAASNA